MYRQYTQPVEADYTSSRDFQEALDAWEEEQTLRSSYIYDKYPKISTLNPICHDKC